MRRFCRPLVDNRVQVRKQRSTGARVLAACEHHYVTIWVVCILSFSSGAKPYGPSMPAHISVAAVRSGPGQRLRGDSSPCIILLPTQRPGGRARSREDPWPLYGHTWRGGVSPLKTILKRAHFSENCLFSATFIKGGSKFSNSTTTRRHHHHTPPPQHARIGSRPAGRLTQKCTRPVRP